MQAKGKAASQEMMQLTEAGIPAWQMLADKIGVSVPEAMKMVEKGAVSADTALRLAAYFGTSAELWLNLQSEYDLRQARRTLGPEIERTVRKRPAA